MMRMAIVVPSLDQIAILVQNSRGHNAAPHKDGNEDVALAEAVGAVRKETLAQAHGDAVDEGEPRSASVLSGDHSLCGDLEKHSVQPKMVHKVVGHHVEVET